VATPSTRKTTNKPLICEALERDLVRSSNGSGMAVHSCRPALASRSTFCR
jgi:hypothetical protein